MESIWTKDIEKPSFERLKRDIKTDVLIIGGGISGILCSYMLTKAGVDNLLLEANTICSGTTKNTTAKLTLAHGLIYDKLISEFGLSFAKMYLKSQQYALQNLSVLCKKTDCDYEVRDSYVYSVRDALKIEREVKALNTLGMCAEFCKDTNLPFSVAGAVRLGNQAQFHPLKLLYSIARGLNIYENTRVLKLDGNIAKTEHGTVCARKIIVATHFPFIDRYGLYFIKMHQHRSYVLALENAPQLDGMYVDECDKGLSFRNYKNLLLLGGGGHRTGKTGGSFIELEEFKNKYFVGSKEVCRFATQDCITLDSVAYIGNYTKLRPDLYVATGFNKWGMSNSYLSAKILTDEMLGKKNEFSKVYNPMRSILRTDLAVNLFETVTNFVKPTRPRCSHLGCALTYNKFEHTWDCACHGSRFNKDGKILDGPANKDKSLK